MQAIINRATEPSTHAGIAAAAQAAAFFFPQYANIFALITAITATSAVAIPEKG